MRSGPFVALLHIFLFLASCASTNDMEKEPPLPMYPSEVKKIQSFFLLGDAGHDSNSENHGLEALKVYLDSAAPTQGYMLFLGDNIHTKSFTSPEPGKKKFAKINLDKQIELAQQSQLKTIFIPGEHEWPSYGLSGLEKVKNYIESKLNRSEVFMPRIGCPLQFVDISEDVHLIILDSQWYINDWDNHPTINDDCPEIKTREAMFTEVETELKKNQNKTTVFAVHHPLYSNGVHGGAFYLTPYLNPSEKKTPIPLIGSLGMLLRTSGGLSSQDILNPRYQSLVDRLETISQKWGKVVFVSGHDHSLQYIENPPVKQIISGAASLTSYAGLRNNGLFAHQGPGFGIFEVFEDGSSWISFYSGENPPEILFQKQVFSPHRTYPIDTLPHTFPRTVKISVYPNRKKEIKGFINSFWGEGYRNFFVKDIAVPTADLDTLYGGLEPMRMGGGQQTNSLRVRDSLGREYNFRKIRKDPLQLIQAALYKDKPVKGLFGGTLVEHMVRGFYTASHPYGFLAVPTLAEAAGVLHTNPEIYYLPKQPRLGKFNFDHGNDLYMIEERPEEHWLGHPSFGAPNHDIQSTGGLFDRLRRDEKYRLDESAYIRSRIFDMFLGDWDRHNDQWRWAELETNDGNHIFKPIPRDRDQVFSNYDGLFFRILRSTIGIAKKFPVYGADIQDLKQFSRSAITLDRALLQNADRETWLSEARHLQRQLTDQMIEKAFSQFPEELQGQQHENLKKKIKARRDNLLSIAERYYDYLSEVVILKGTDKDDYIDLNILKNGDIKVRISRNKDGKRHEILADRTFKEGETEEILIYGLDDDDRFYAQGNGQSKMAVRLIGGQGNDNYDVIAGNSMTVYDHQSQNNNIESKDNVNTLLTDDFEVNFYDPNRRTPSGTSISPTLSYNPDEGFVPQISLAHSIGNLVEYPFTHRHDLQLRYFSRTKGVDIQYEVEFNNFRGSNNFYIGMYYSSPDHTRNFFGFGNDSRNMEEELSWTYNRIKLEHFRGEVGFKNHSPYGHFLQYTVSFEGFHVLHSDGILSDYPLASSIYDIQYFGGLEGNYRYKSYDSNLTPTTGLDIEVLAGGKMNTRTEQTYAYFHPYLEMYNTITRNRKLVLNSRIQSQINFGNGYEFYQSASLGGNTGLRGYRQQRFSGGHSFSVGGDLLYHLDTFKTPVLPLQLSLFAGSDLGRIWYSELSSNTWHNSYGGGLRINVAKAFGGRFSWFKGDEGWRFTFDLGISF